MKRSKDGSRAKRPPAAERARVRVRRSPRILVHITQQAIEEANRIKSNHCMIVEAIKKQYPEAKSVSVDLQTIRFTDKKKGLRYVYLTPRNAQDALVRWDRGIAIPAFTILLRGGHVTSARRGSGKKQKIVHKLGKRRVIPPGKGDRKVPDTVGGRPVARHHASHNTRRMYGVRGYTLDDVIPVEEKPTGVGQVLEG